MLTPLFSVTVAPVVNAAFPAVPVAPKPPFAVGDEIENIQIGLRGIVCAAPIWKASQRHFWIPIHLVGDETATAEWLDTNFSRAGKVQPRLILVKSAEVVMSNPDLPTKSPSHLPASAARMQIAPSPFEDCPC